MPTPRTLKLYRVEFRCAFVRAPLVEALGLRPHVTQVDIWVAAPTKVAARELITATQWVTPSTTAVQEAMGNDAAAFLAADQLTEPAVYVTHHGAVPRSATDGRPLLRVAADGATALVGHFEGGRQSELRFVPVAVEAGA